MAASPMDRSRASRTLVALLLSLGIAGGVYGLYLLEDLLHLDVLEVLEVKSIDLRFRIRGPVKPSGEVVIAAIDSKSIRELGRWPWTRSVHARMVDRLREWGASAVAFDVLFTEEEGAAEADRLRRIAAALPAGDPKAAEARARIEAALDEALADRALSASLAKTLEEDKALTVLGFDFVFEDDLAHTRQLGIVLGAEEEQLVSDLATYPSRDANAATLRTEPGKLALGIRPVITSLADGCAALGFVNPVYDADGFLRREQVYAVYSPAVREAFEGKKAPGSTLPETKEWVNAFMPLSVAAVATHLRLPIDKIVLDLPASELRFPAPDGRGGTVERKVRFDPFDGTARVNFHGAANTIPTWSISDILAGKLVDAAGRPVEGSRAFAGKLVFVGMSDPGLADFFPSPFTARLPGVEKHAMFAENVLKGQFLRPHDDEDLVVGLTALAVALLVGLSSAWLSAVASAALLLAASGLYYLLTFRDFALSGLVWNWTVPALAMLLGYAAVTAWRQLTEERAKRHVRSVFSTYMSPEAVAKVLSNPEALKLGGEKRVCTLFFSDLVGFTSLSERLSEPEALVAIMNRYLGRMSAVIRSEDGIVDKFIGDAVMAIFGAPVIHDDHPTRALSAALRSLEVLEELRAEFRAEGLPDIDCRIGINTGDVVIGNVGSEDQKNYTCLGDAVNLASRLEGANKAYGTRIMVGERTHAEAVKHDRDFFFRRLDRLAVKGKDRPVEVYELVGRYSSIAPEKRQTIAAFEAALDDYRGRRFGDAIHGFRRVLELDPADGPATTYLERCRVFLHDPPPAGWDGVFHLKTK